MWMYITLGGLEFKRLNSVSDMSSSSDDDFELEQVLSQGKLPEYSVVPSDTKYSFKLKKSNGELYCKVEYILRKGKKLPYVTFVKGRSKK